MLIKKHHGAQTLNTKNEMSNDIYVAWLQVGKVGLEGLL